MTVAYLQDTAQQAGLKTEALAMRAIGWDPREEFCRSAWQGAIRTIFKLYPWEWLLKDGFGEHALASMQPSADDGPVD